MFLKDTSAKFSPQNISGAARYSLSLISFIGSKAVSWFWFLVSMFPVLFCSLSSCRVSLSSHVSVQCFICSSSHSVRLIVCRVFLGSVFLRPVITGSVLCCEYSCLSPAFCCLCFALNVTSDIIKIPK